MAMQKSDELADVAGLMFQQVKELGISAWTIGFNVWSDDNNKYTDYHHRPLRGIIEPYTMDTTLFHRLKRWVMPKKVGKSFMCNIWRVTYSRETYLELIKLETKISM